ncbi:MAG: VirB3 family type IV secretion system protein [Gammaproteobacteria bacterium]|nr:VirB3 family type IV secretion system protein [Gammaproteobacteria bacterium]
MTDRGITADVLFVGVTRPPMRWGVTYAALMLNMVFTMEAFLVTRNLLALLLCVPIHGVCALLCLQDPRFFDLLLLWGRTRLPGWLCGAHTWRASSYGPLIIDLPDRRAYRPARTVSAVAGSVGGASRPW